MSVKIRKIISHSLNFFAAAFIAFVLYGFLTLGYKPELIENAKLSSLLTEMVAIRQGVTLYCNGTVDKKSGMPESQKFYYSLLSDDKGARLSILLRNQAMKEFPMNGQSAQYIDEKLDDGFPMTGKMKFTGKPSCLTQSDKNIVLYNENYDGECSAFTIEMDCKELEKDLQELQDIGKAMNKDGR